MVSDASEATANFGRAKELFRTGQFTESMRLLVELDRQFPNTANILLAMAFCLEKLDCPGEAEQICDRLLALAPNAKAAELKGRINATRGTSGVVDLYAPIDLDPPALPKVPRPPTAAAETPDRRRLYIIGAVVIFVVLFLALPLALRRAQPPSPAVTQQTQSAATAQARTAQDPAQPTAVAPLDKAAVLLLVLLVSYVVTLLVLYPCLMFMGALREETFQANLLDLATTVVIMYLWCLIPLVGGIFAIMHFMRHYGLGCLAALILLTFAGLLQYILVRVVLISLLFGMGYLAMNAAH